ncbi:MAG: Uma2 family endonuclease [Gloeomargarita sp. SKYG116]|nr:Uma2 family endonuclease [Gloeomargarita sp. SKYG116]MDW8401509.1 Uma2 family endonuclease [Gloeomargarita sp. SKYGB_i_bin116]
MVSIQGQSLPAKKAWTDEEFRALPDDGHRYEVVNGKLVVMGAAGARHGYYVSLMHIILGSYVRSQKLGFTFDPDTSFKMASGNRRSPDCSFFSKERIKALGGIPKGYIEGSPDLVVEVLSPDNTVEEMHSKIVEYFENGTRLVWVIHPDEKYVLVYHQPEPDQFKRPGDCLSGEDVIPDFALDLAEFFAEPEF